MKYNRIVVDDDSIVLAFRKQMVSTHRGADLFVSVLAYLSELDDQTEADEKIVALGKAPAEAELRAADEVEQLDLQISAVNFQRLKRQAYAEVGSGWETVWIETMSSAQIAATLGTDSDPQHSALIVTADKRLLSHLTDYTHVLLQGQWDAGASLWKLERFRSQYSFEPRLYPVFRALTGLDVRDRVPYMTPKRAIELLASYPNLVDLLNEYICDGLVVEENLRSQVRSMSKYLRETIEASIVRANPKLVGLWQTMNSEFDFGFDGREEE